MPRSCSRSRARRPSSRRSGGALGERRGRGARAVARVRRSRRRAAVAPRRPTKPSTSRSADRRAATQPGDAVAQSHEQRRRPRATAATARARTAIGGVTPKRCGSTVAVETGTGRVSVGGGGITAVSVASSVDAASRTAGRRRRAPAAAPPQTRQLQRHGPPRAPSAGARSPAAPLAARGGVERAQRLGGLPPERADERAVVLVRRSSRCGGRTRAPSAPRARGRAPRAARAGCCSSSSRLVEHGRSRARARAGTGRATKRTHATASATPSTSAASRHASAGASAGPRGEPALLARVGPERDSAPSRKTSPASQMRFTSGLTKTLK